MSPSLKKHVAALITLAVICGALFANTLSNDLVWDDTYLVTENDYFKQLKNIPLFFTPHYWNHLHPFQAQGSYRPIRTVTLALDYYIWRTRPAGYHLTNLLLHTMNVLLVYCLVLMIGGISPYEGRPVGAVAAKRASVDHCSGDKPSWFFSLPFLGALFFAAHPVHTESVCLVKNRSDLLSFFFCLATFILFIQFFRSSSRRRYVCFYTGSLICFCLALMSKEMSLILPALLSVYGLCFVLPNHRRPVVIGSTIPFWGLVGAYIWFRVTLLETTGATTLDFALPYWQHALLVVKTVGVYLKLLFFPVGLTTEHLLDLPQSPLELPLILTSVSLLMLGVALGITYNRLPLLFFCLCWLVLSLLPVSNLLILASRPIAEQRLYFSSFGFCLFLAMVASGLCSGYAPWYDDKNRVPLLIITAIVAFYTVQTVRRNADWRDEITFYTRTLETTPKSFKSYSGLGVAWAGRGDYDKALNYFRAALKLRPDYVQSHYNLGCILMERGDLEKAKSSFETALHIKPNDAKLHFGLGRLFARQNDFERAIARLNTAVELNPGYLAAHTGLGAIFTRQKQFDKALEHYFVALRLNPDYAATHQSLADIFAMQGDADKAIQHYRKALSIDPTFAKAQQGLHAILESGQETRAQDREDDRSGLPLLCF